MIIDTEYQKIMPSGWELWMTSTRWQSMQTDATESNKKSYSPLVKSRGDAIRFAKNMAATCSA